jgi:DNA-binding PadR family transcriptional regulator
MAIRECLLAILDLGPCYGYQLRLEFEERTGGTWSLNVGQVYTTLDRLERDRLATKGAADDAGHIRYAITSAGRAESSRWLTAAIERELGERDDLAVKVALAFTLPGVDVAALLKTQRDATAASLDRLRASTSGSLSRDIVNDSLIRAAEAHLEWLGACERRLSDASPYGISQEPPKRGRPTRAAT